MAKYSCRPAPKNLLSPKQPAKKTGFAKPVLIAVLAGAAVVVGAVVWIVIATIGKKPKDINTNIKADGVFVTEGSVSSSAVTAEKEGIVSEVLVSDGDQVSAGQQIALLDSEEAQTKLDELTARRDSVDKVTFDSKNDPITDDTKKLQDIKSQWITTSSELDTNKALLKTKENELAEQQKKVTEAKNAQEEARKAYNAISATTTADTTSQQNAYTDARSALQTAIDDQESAEAALALAQDKLDDLLAQLKPLEDDLASAKNALSEAQANAMSAESHMKDMESDMLAAKSNWEAATFAFQNAGPNEDRPALAAAADAAKSSYDNAYDIYIDARRAYDTAASMVKDAQDKVDECQKPVDDLEPKIAKAREELASAQDLADAWKDKVAAAQTTCDEAEKAYEDAKQAQAKRQADISNAYTKYQEASNAYSKATKDLTVLQNSVDQLKARIADQEANLTKQETELLQKFNSTKDSILEQLDQEIAENKQIIEEAVILSTMDGVISGINIAKGDAVEQGTTVCDIVYDSNTEQKVICYVPAAEAGKLKTGMSVDIVVSGFDEKEYGHLEGTVQNVAKSGSSQDKVAVTIALRADSDTVSGFWWSANNGASVTIADGTAVTAEFIAKG
ncbi:MAG: HlyD family efflux transporter periplasmic adaptor subunit [Clostridiales bacterium]|nr:HlyD family efflux transporter periplasmic adaptor subunit [Clostridiales bacterium]